MKGRFTEQYDLCLTKQEMAELMQGFRIYVREFDVSTTAEELLEALEEVYVGETGGRGVLARAD